MDSLRETRRERERKLKPRWECTVCEETLGPETPYAYRAVDEPGKWCQDCAALHLPHGAAPISLMCALCLEDSTESMQLVEYDFACIACVRRQIHKAMTHEAQYPFNIRPDQDLAPEDFGLLFEDELIEKFAKKKQEYKTPVSERVYCVCGTFLGRMSSKDLPDSTIDLKKCRCDRVFCMRYASHQAHMDVAMSHTDCKAKRTAKEAEHRELMADLDRAGNRWGVDWQICPACQKVVQLSEGCLHVNRPFGCGKEFCFSCGKEYQLGHLIEGRCPPEDFEMSDEDSDDE
jgi:hypothetical protein